MSNADKVISYDLDSTMFNVQHREHLAPEEHLKGALENWIPYSKGCVDDTVVEGIAESARLFKAAGYRIHIVSGRNVEAYDETVWSLNTNDIPYDEIRLHTSDDPRHNGEYKAAYLNSLRDRGLTPMLMFEDHEAVCAIIETQAHVPCITVRPRYEDNIGVSFNLNETKSLVL